MKVTPMKSPRSGRPVPNQNIIFSPEATVFQSYDSVIVKTCFEDGKRVVYLDETYWDYSNTTRKYRNAFLGENSGVIKSKIASGEYRLTNLN